MNYKELAKKYRLLFRINIIITVLIAICFIDNIAVVVMTVMVALAVIASATISIMLMRWSLFVMTLELYVSEQTYKSAYISYNIRKQKGFVTSNFYDITGLECDKYISNQYEYNEIINNLKAKVYSEEDNIYKHQKHDRWIKMLKFSSGVKTVWILQDVTDTVLSNKMLNDLEYYDSRTKLLSFETFCKKIQQYFISNPDDTVCACKLTLWAKDRKKTLNYNEQLNQPISEVASILRNNQIKTMQASFNLPNEFIVFFEKNSQIDFEDEINKLYNIVKLHMADFPIEVYCGYCIKDDDCNTPEKLMQYTEFAVNNAKHRKMNLPVAFSAEDYEQYKGKYQKIECFRKIMNNNLILYSFQPIVNAQTGEIYAYEALMRPQKTNGIQLNPLDMIAIASEEDMLYAIERATLFNIFDFIYKNQNLFEDRKLFINSVPSCMLTDEDYNMLVEKYQFLFEKVVIEILESDDVTESKVELLNNRYRQYNASIAIDDFGAGHSNESNLLKIKPDYIKIDRSLIANINVDNQKAHLVKNMINYASQHDIVTLAEGVETAEELNAVIAVGVDLIQGYYTSKPIPVLINKIPGAIKEQIYKLNLQTKGYVSKVYNADKEETINLVSLSLEEYTQININADNVTVSGDIDNSCKIKIVIADNSSYKVNLRSINIDGFDGPSVVVGKDCNTVLNLDEDNKITNGGIRVPDGARLTLEGTGNLSLMCTNKHTVGIGGNYHQSYGALVFNGTGKIDINISGDNVVGIGGGAGKDSSLIEILSGIVSVTVKGENIIGIGSITGDCSLSVYNSVVNVQGDGQQVAGIGSLTGNVQSELCGNISIRCSGDDCVAVGTLMGSSVDIIYYTGKFNAKVNAKSSVGMGSDNSACNCNIIITNGNFNIDTSGDSAICIGSAKGTGKIEIMNGNIYAVEHSSLSLPTICLENGTIVITGGNIATNDINPLVAVSANGDILDRYMFDNSKKFEEQIETVNGKYIYAATDFNDDNKLYLYLPKDFTGSFDKNLLKQGNETRV